MDLIVFPSCSDESDNPIDYPYMPVLDLLESNSNNEQIIEKCYYEQVN